MRIDISIYRLVSYVNNNIFLCYKKTSHSALNGSLLLGMDIAENVVSHITVFPQNYWWYLHIFTHNFYFDFKWIAVDLKKKTIWNMVWNRNFTCSFLFNIEFNTYHSPYHILYQAQTPISYVLSRNIVNADIYILYMRCLNCLIMSFLISVI